MDDYSLVRFLPLDPTDEDSINDVLIQVDMAIQYGEDLEPKEQRVGVFVSYLCGDCLCVCVCVCVCCLLYTSDAADES